MLTEGQESFGPLTVSYNMTKELIGILVYTSLSVTLVSVGLLVRELPFWVLTSQASKAPSPGESHVHLSSSTE